MWGSGALRRGGELLLGSYGGGGLLVDLSSLRGRRVCLRHRPGGRTDIRAVRGAMGGKGKGRDACRMMGGIGNVLRTTRFTGSDGSSAFSATIPSFIFFKISSSF